MTAPKKATEVVAYMQAARALHFKGCSVNTIAAGLHRNRKTIIRYLRDSGVAPPYRDDAKPVSPKRKKK